MVDLHTHSSASDGDLSPFSLIQEAAKRGIRAIALTDHDTINGLESARAHAAASGIHFIPGIEISISWASGKLKDSVLALGTGPGSGSEFHLLGLGISKPSGAFLSAVGELARRREARNREIMEKMKELGIEATWEELTALSGGDSVGRPHFASLLVKRKIVPTRELAFSRYLGAGKPLFVRKEGMNFEEAVHLIRASNGIPVLAHPMSLYIAWGRLDDFIKILKDLGLMGLEAWHPAAKPAACRRLEALANAFDLYITEGSDFHGASAPDRKLGKSNSGRDIRCEILKAIPELDFPVSAP